LYSFTCSKSLLACQADPGSNCYQEMASAADAATAYRRIAALP